MKMGNSNHNLSRLEEMLQLNFKEPKLLQQALTHRSFLNENRTLGLSSNERMEFLGDSILSFWVSSIVYHKFPSLAEGQLTFIRTHLVRTETLTNLAEKLSLGEFLLMSKGEEQGGGRENPVLLANSFEALIGAVYLDQGLKVAFQFLEKNFAPLISQINNINAFRDSKSVLQEAVQAKGYPSPVYRQSAETGPDHQKTFTMAVFIGDICLAEGTSHSKQEAEEQAAQKALSENTLEKLPKIR